MTIASSVSSEIWITGRSRSRHATVPNQLSSVLMEPIEPLGDEGLTDLGFQQAAVLAERLQKELRPREAVCSTVPLSVPWRKDRQEARPHPSVLR